MGCPAAWAGALAAQAPPRGVNPAWPEGEAPALLTVVGRGMLWGEWNPPGAQGASPDASSTGTSAQLGVRGGWTALLGGPAWPGSCRGGGDPEDGVEVGGRSTLGKEGRVAPGPGWASVSLLESGRWWGRS